MSLRRRTASATSGKTAWIFWTVAGLSVVAVGLRLMTAVDLGGAMRSGDFDRFYELARSGGRPYVAYAVEYPPLTLALFKAIALFTVGRSEFGHVLVWLNLAADLGIACILAWVWGPVAAAFYLLSAMTMVHLLDQRVDTLSTVLATFGVAAWVRRRPATGGASIGIATFLKLWPAPLALLGLGRLAVGSSRERLRFTVAAFGVMGAIGGAWLLVAGVHGVAQVFTYRHATGWEVESIPGVALLALHRGTITLQSGAFRIGHYGYLWRLFLWGTSIPLAIWSALRGSRVNRIGLAWVCSVGALMVLSALLSPQFMIWILPGAAIAWVEGDRRVALLVGICGPLTGLEMTHFGWLLEARPAWLLLVGARDLLLLAAVILAAWELRRIRPEGPPTTRALPLADPSVLVVVPTYDEADNILVALSRIRAALPRASVLVVDDGSPDGTGDIVSGMAAQDPDIHLLRRPRKSGLGTAYQDGFAWGLARDFDVLVEIDADLSHDPAELPRLVEAASCDCDLAIGCALHRRRPHRGLAAAARTAVTGRQPLRGGPPPATGARRHLRLPGLPGLGGGPPGGRRARRRGIRLPDPDGAPRPGDRRGDPGATHHLRRPPVGPVEDARRDHHRGRPGGAAGGDHRPGPSEATRRSALLPTGPPRPHAGGTDRVRGPRLPGVVRQPAGGRRRGRGHLRYLVGRRTAVLNSLSGMGDLSDGDA